MAQAWSSRETLGRAQLGAAGARIAPDLFVARHDRLLGQYLHELLAALEGAERMFHDAIFERMEADHDEPASGAQPPHGGRDEPIEPFELAVRPDPKRLKRPRRRI